MTRALLTPAILCLLLASACDQREERIERAEFLADAAHEQVRSAVTGEISEPGPFPDTASDDEASRGG